MKCNSQSRKRSIGAQRRIALFELLNVGKNVWHQLGPRCYCGRRAMSLPNGCRNPVVVSFPT